MELKVQKIDERRQGTVLWYSIKYNVGAIVDKEEKVYFVFGSDLDQINFLAAGDEVIFEPMDQFARAVNFFHLCEGGNPVGKADAQCEQEGCETCCEHWEHDHYVCMDCGAQLEPGDFYDEDYGQDR